MSFPTHLPSFMAFAFPLHDRCQAGNLAGVQHWLAQGSDPNRRTPSGLTPLHLACAAHQRASEKRKWATLAIIKQLIKHGALVQPDAAGRLPLLPDLSSQAAVGVPALARA
jgi:ankyrin repeat protein